MHRAFKAGAIAASALAAGALIVPQVASGNARTNQATNAELAAVRPLTTLLKGSNESPPGDPDGSGAAAVTIGVSAADPTVPNVCFDLSVTGLDTPVAAHIHAGVAGVNGPIVVDFTPPTSGASSGCASGAALHPQGGQTAVQLLADIATNPDHYYVNVHTTAFPGGAVRGQLAPNVAPAGGTHLLPTPLRAYDSRATGAGGPVVGNAAARTISLLTGKDATGASALAVPPGATGAMLTVTVTDTAGPGFLTVYSGALAQTPGTSNLNFDHAGAIQAVNTTVAVDNLSQIKVFAGSHSTDVVIDVIGYTF